MATTTSFPSSSSRSVSLVALLAVFLGTLVAGYGFLLVPASVLGGLWIAAIGVSLALSGAFATPRFVARLGLSAADGRTFSLAFAALAALLLVAFVVVNYASFEAVDSGSSSA
jgi:hypothetical protein